MTAASSATSWSASAARRGRQRDRCATASRSRRRAVATLSVDDHRRVLSLPFLFVLARKPVLRRLALRNAARRPRETALVVLGSLLGTAIMTGSFVVGDTFNVVDPPHRVRAARSRSTRSCRRSGLAAGPALDARFAGLSRSRRRRHPRGHGHERVVASVASTGRRVRAAPKAQLLETDFAAARRFGGDAHATGISGPTPGPGEAAIGADLARVAARRRRRRDRSVRVRHRERLRVVAGAPEARGRRLLDRRRDARRTTCSSRRARSRRSSRRARPAPPRPAASRSCSCRTGAASKPAPSSPARSSRVDLDAVGRRSQSSVNDAKQAVLDRADRSGQSLSRLYSSLGTFAVLAGILLLVNIFFMLADERKSELGMLRAVGLRRVSLVGAFAAEGWCYAVLSAIAGTFVGLGLGRALMAAAAKLFSRRGDDSGIALHFAFKWASVQRGIVVGFVIAIVDGGAHERLAQPLQHHPGDPRHHRARVGAGPRRRSSYLGLACAGARTVADGSRRGRRLVPRARCSARCSCSSASARCSPATSRARR